MKGVFDPSLIFNKYNELEQRTTTSVNPDTRRQFETFVKSPVFKEVYLHFVKNALLPKPKLGNTQDAPLKAYAYYQQQQGVALVFSTMFTTAGLTPADVLGPADLNSVFNARKQ